MRTASFLEEERYAYNALGQLVQVDDSTGAVRRIAYNEAGQPAGTLDPLGRYTLQQAVVEPIIWKADPCHARYG